VNAEPVWKIRAVGGGHFLDNGCPVNVDEAKVLKATFCRTIKFSPTLDWGRQMLQFDAETTRLLEIVYQGADVTRRRQATFDALAPRPGEVILDVGCGNGLLTVELARAVGPTGRVIGVDPSAEMRKPALARCGDFEWVDTVDGIANQLPVESHSVDKAVSVQVFEYLQDIKGAIQEAHRALKPNGRLIVGDVHFDSFIWSSDDPDRMNRMIASWDHHLTERCVPQILPGILRDCGFAVDEVRPFTFCDHILKPDGLASMMMRLMERYAVENNHFSAGEAKAWFDEQLTLATEGRFFFSLTHFVVCAQKTPAAQPA